MLLKKVKILSIVGSIFLILYMLTSICYVASASPKLSYREIGGEFSIISTFETKFDTTVQNRTTNIKLAAKKLNGTVVFPDDEFSFNLAVGERSEKQGYKMAKVIVNSKYQDDFGGGVCQVSTTLFNAVILANLKITESHQHTLKPSYIEPSFDAMVSYGYRDLRFINNSKGVIIIFARVEGNKIIIDIKSTNPAPSIKIERVSIVEKIIPFERKSVDKKSIVDDKMTPHEIIIDEFGVPHLSFGIDGMKSSSFLNYYEDGKLIRREKLRSDTYKRIDEVIIVDGK